ncbi:MAG: hypothetical protein QOE92_1753 [Chloroflexota bacterium]|jgi:hypothetical protein|nr:hypothetical protein [Chloroflexota bacterium]
MTPWIIGGVSCLVLLVLACGGAGYAVYRGVGALNPVAASPPADFPVYPGARQQSAIGFHPNDQVGTISTIQWVTVDPADTVLAYYRTNLARGAWRITDERKTGIATRLTIESTRGDAGYLQVQGILNQTQIQLSIGGRGALGSIPTPT